MASFFPAAVSVLNAKAGGHFLYGDPAWIKACRETLDPLFHYLCRSQGCQIVWLLCL